MDKRVDRPKRFAFIPVNGLGKPKKCNDKTLIRRHVMHGRNLRIGVRPVPTLDSRLAQAPTDGGVSECSFERERHNSHAEAESGGAEYDATMSLAVRSCVSPFRFYHNLDACSQGLTFDFYTGSSSAICSPGMGVDFDLGERLWHQWVIRDATYTHSILFCISASYCILQRSPLSKTALYHLDKTIKSLNQRLADPLLSLHDSTTCMVSSLVLAFSSLGEHATARVHMKGLVQMARLRGGLGRFRHCGDLLTKLARCDLASAIHSNEEPIFLHDHLENQDTFLDEYSDTLNPCLIVSDTDVELRGTLSIGPIAGIDDGHLVCPKAPQLISVLRRVQKVSHQLNSDPSQTVKQLCTVQTQNLIHLLQYQLLALRDSFAVTDVDLAQKALCLALLAFLTSASEVSMSAQQRRDISADDSDLEESLRACCIAVTLPPQSSGQRSPRGTLIWILLVGAMTAFKVGVTPMSSADVFPDDTTWLRDCWNAELGGGAMTWEELRSKMKAIAWINAIHDKPGRRAFDALCSVNC